MSTFACANIYLRTLKLSNAKSSKISTTRLASNNGINKNELFSKLAEHGYILRQDNMWILTPKGSNAGGSYVNSDDFGNYIVWSQDLDVKSLLTDGTLSAAEKFNNRKISVKDIGKHYQIAPSTVLLVLYELGWISRYIKGWHVTPMGTTNGALQRHVDATGVPYVLWDELILKNINLSEAIYNANGKSIGNSTDKSFSTFRQKFEAKFRCLDGHYVRSEAEMLIDNWLYLNNISHAYERALNLYEIQFSFYLPVARCCIEYISPDLPQKKLEELEIKRKILQENEIDTLFFSNSDLDNIDNILNKFLLKQKQLVL